MNKHIHQYRFNSDRDKMQSNLFSCSFLHNKYTISLKPQALRENNAAGLQGQIQDVVNGCHYNNHKYLIYFKIISI